MEKPNRWCAARRLTLAPFLIEVKLFRRERRAARHDDSAVPSVEIGALDRAIVDVGTGAHIGPVDMTGSGIDRDAIRHLTIGNNDPVVGAVRVHRMNATAAQLEKE